MPEQKSWCRDCDELCGITARVEEGRVVEIAGDTEHPITRGRDCPWGRAAAARLDVPGRWLRPRLRRQGALEETDWSTALDGLGEALAAVVAERGARAVGLLLGPRMERSPRLWAEVARLRRALGPIRVFGHRASLEAPWRQATRHVLGAPVALRADLARAQHLLLLGAGLEEGGCSFGYAGQDLRRRMVGGPGRRAPHVTAVDPRRTALAREARAHLQARPGTELYLLLGMIATILRKGWWDRQHVADHTRGLDALEAAVGSWSAARAAELCGLAPADITAEAMRFSRAATAVALTSPQALGTPWAGLVAWATLVLEFLTANALKPGGLYAPVPVEWGLAEPAEALGVAVGAGLAALVCVEADPEALLPGRSARLAELQVLACLDLSLGGASGAAGYLLPTTGWPEEADRWPAGGADHHWRAETAALCPPRGEARPAADVLAELAWNLGRRHGPVEPSHGIEPAEPVGGPVDRARWAVAHVDGRAQLLPPVIAALLERHVPVPPSPAFPMALLGGARLGRGGIASARREVLLPVTSGIPDGAEVRLVSAWGTVEGRALLAPDLRPDCAMVPADGALHLADLADPWHRDPLGGRVWTDGQPVRVERL